MRSPMWPRMALLACADLAQSARRLESHVSAGRQNGNAPTHLQHAGDWPELPPHVVAELEQIEFRVSGPEARDARIEELMQRAESLREGIARWIGCVRRHEAAGAKQAR
jgi:hypothetical protein